MTWDAYNRRKSALRDVLELADRRRTTDVADLIDSVPAAREAFADDAELLREVQMAWYQRLSGTLDRGVLEGDSPALVAVTAWVAAAAQMPGARTLLDAHLDHPGLHVALAKERVLLATSAGISAYHPDLDGEGARLVEQARDQAVYPEVVAEDESRGLLARLRNALAA